MAVDNPTEKAREIFQSYLEQPTRRNLERVIRAYQQFVWATALRVTRNRQDAADICQDVFLKLLLDPPPPEGVRSARSYLAWKVVGRATNLQRAVERRESREATGRELAQSDGLSVEDVEAIHEAIAELPDDLRDVIQLRYLAGLPNREIAGIHGITERAVEERLRRARDRLRRRLGTALLSLLPALSTPSGAGPSLPLELSTDLVRLARNGQALAALSAGAGTAGACLTVKKTIVAVAAVIALLGIGYVGTRESNEPGEPAVAGVVLPASSPPATTESPPERAEAAGSGLQDEGDGRHGSFGGPHLVERKSWSLCFYACTIVIRVAALSVR